MPPNTLYTMEPIRVKRVVRPTKSARRYSDTWFSRGSRIGGWSAFKTLKDHVRGAVGSRVVSMAGREY
jgi:hypothetical protein